MLEGFLQPLERRARLLELEQHPTHAVEVSRVLRLQFHRSFDQFFRLVEFFPAIGPHITEVIHRFGEIRGQFEALAEIFLRLRVVAVAFQRRAELKIKNVGETVRLARFRDHFRFREMSDGLAVFPGARVRHAGKELHQEIFLEPRAGLVQQFERVARLVQTDFHIGQPVINRLKLGFERQRLFEIARGVGEALLLVSDVAEKIIGLFVARVIARNRFQLFLRLVLFPGPQINVGQLLARAGQRRKTVQQLQIKRFGAGKFSGQFKVIGQFLNHQQILGFQARGPFQRRDSPGLDARTFLRMKLAVVDIKFAQFNPKLRVF